MRNFNFIMYLMALSLIFSSSIIYKNNENPIGNNTKNNAFTYGEKLNYKISYGLIEAGHVQLNVKKTSKKFQNRNVYHIIGLGSSSKTFDWFFKIRDRYESYVDYEKLVPLLFIRDVNEGGYVIKQTYEFDHKKRVVNTEKGSFSIKKNIQDMLSCFYFARTLDLNNLKKGDILTFNAFVDEESYPLKVKFLGKEIIKIKSGKFKALKFCPIVQTGRIFKTEESLSVWISDDYNKTPLLVKANILFGALRMEMIKMEGELNPSSVIR